MTEFHFGMNCFFEMISSGAVHHRDQGLNKVPLAQLLSALTVLGW